MIREASALLLLLFSCQASALDGKWTPKQVLDIDPAWLTQQGLKLKPEQLWDKQRGTGMLSGAINIAGCSGAFISKSGLIATNHHCLFGVLQEHSTPERDLIRDGFLARTPGEELASPTLRVEVPQRFSDVSDQVLGAVPRGATPVQRLRAIKAALISIARGCEKSAGRVGLRCKVSVDDEGVRYTLIETLELKDVRLVYAPPRAIGEFGGEIDNWSWPRHTGDFAIARAYAQADGTPNEFHADNKAYAPEFFFRVARAELKDGDFVMVLGYPGVTYRALIAEEMAERRTRFFPRREEVFGELIAALEQASARDAKASIALAANIKGILNRYKNAQGQMAGLDRGAVVAKQQALDAQVLAFAEKEPAHQQAIAAHQALREVLAARGKTWERDFLLNLIAMGNEQRAGSIPPLPKALYFAATLAHQARERALPDAARAEGFNDAELPRLQQRFAREQQNFDAAADQAVFFLLIKRVLALPEPQRISALDSYFTGLDDQALRQKIESLYSSPVLQAKSQSALLSADFASLQQQRDALMDIGIAWNDALRAARAQDLAFEALSALHRPVWRGAMQAYLQKPIAPDANGTLRVSFAHVQGYMPRDGLRYTPFTTLAGVLEKNTGKPPFDVPAALQTALQQPPKRTLCQVPADSLTVNFLADGDTSGGNSGSPVVNARGELVGINFDRVWENVAGDFAFNPAVSRNISVDIRYLLWNLACVTQADTLLHEIGVSP
jgi:hypothetical protein